jgi:hypothetical protein
MSKRIVFLAVVVLSISSVASAGVWSWVIGFIPWQQNTPNSQQQATVGTMGQIGVQVGSGTSSGTNTQSYSSTQTSPSGNATQSTNVTGTQQTSITGGPGSVGTSLQSTTVVTYQYQSY